MADCIGCGYCCYLEDCVTHHNFSGMEKKKKTLCEFMVWIGARYFCDLILNGETHGIHARLGEG